MNWVWFVVNCYVSHMCWGMATEMFKHEREVVGWVFIFLSAGNFAHALVSVT